MNDPLKQLKRLLTSITLSRKEKSFIKDSLLAYMEMKPAQTPERSPQSILAPFSLTPRLSGAVSAAVIAAVLATGVAFAAEDTLPGDALYSVKVNVTEKVRTFIAVGSEAGANIEAQLAERRLKEAEKLAVRGDLNEEKAQQIAERFKKHTDRVEGHIKTIEATNNTEAVEGVSSEVETSLQAHIKILDSLSISASDEVREGLNALGDTVKEELLQASEPSKQIERIAQENEELAKKLVVEKEISALARLEEARVLLGESRGSFSEKTLTDTDKKVTEVAALLEEGERHVDAGKFVEAFKAFREAQGIAGEVIVVLQAAKDLAVDVEVNGETATSTNATSTSETGIDLDIATSTDSGESATTTATSTEVEQATSTEQNESE